MASKKGAKNTLLLKIHLMADKLHSSAYLKLLILLSPIFTPFSPESSEAFHMINRLVYRLNS